MTLFRHGGAWTALIILSFLLAFLLQEASIPAAMLLGPMLVGVVFALRGEPLVPPHWAFTAAQGIIGCMVAKTITPTTLSTLARDWPVMLVIIGMIILFGALLGFALMRHGSLPGSTAAWGTSPGGATAMTAMAESFGADIRMVAFMQYLRVFMVVLTASVVSRILLGHAPAPLAPGWRLGFDAPPVPFAETALLIGVGIFLGGKLHMPAGSLLLPMIFGASLNAAGILEITLPPWTLWCAYAALGWYIGLRFDRETVLRAVRVVPQLLATIFALIAFSFGTAWLLTRLTGRDLLSAYLATSPGGLDTVAAIAMGSGCDVPFVLAMQTLRLFAVVLVSPFMARLVCRLGARRDEKMP